MQSSKKTELVKETYMDSFALQFPTFPGKTIENSCKGSSQIDCI